MPTRKATEERTDIASPAMLNQAEGGIPLDTAGLRFPHPTKLICNAEYIASHLNLKARAVRGWAAQYDIPGWTIGGERFFDAEEFLSHMPRFGDEETSERGGNAPEASQGAMESDSGDRVEAKRKTRKKNKDVS